MPASLREQILSYIRANVRGVSTKDLQDGIPALATPVPALGLQMVVSTCNELIKEQLVTIHQDKNGNILYKATAITANTDVVKNADNEEKVVYRIIESSGSKGMWIRDIRLKSNLQPKLLDKVLRNMESKKLIKAVKAMTSRRKVYMLYDLNPDVSLTGGNWYSDEGFDANFVEALGTACQRFLDMKRENAKKLTGGPLVVNNSSYASVAEVRKFINDLGLSKVTLSEDEISEILMTLCYDDKVDRKLSVDGNHLYKSVESLLPPPGFVRTPCGTCPVFENCNTSTAINPRGCTYLKDWLL